MHKYCLRLFLLLATLLIAVKNADARNFQAKILSVKDQVILLSLKTNASWKKNKVIYIFDEDEDILKGSVKKIKSEKIWLKVKAANEDILWEKGDHVLVSANKPQITTTPNFSDRSESLVLNYHLGLVNRSNNVLLENAKQEYKAESNQGQLLSLSIEKRYSNDQNFYSIGMVMLAGEIAQKSSYNAGKIDLTYKAFLAGLSLNIGHKFNQKWYAMLGVHHYHPIHHQVSIDSPTGTIKHTPDSSFELRSHATIFALGYLLSPKAGVEFGAVFKPIIFGGFQGRGFSAITIGGFHAL